MSANATLLLICVIYGIIGIVTIMLLRKASRYLADRLLLPDDNIPLYLQKIDTVSEDNIRRLWLISFIVTNLFAAYFSFLSNMNSIKAGPLLASIITLLTLIPSVWITYYCAYYKRGSAFLLYLIISLPLSFFFLGMNELIKPIFMWTAPLKISGLLYFPTVIFFWICSIKLRKVNLTRRYHKNALALREKFKELQD